MIQPTNTNLSQRVDLCFTEPAAAQLALSLGDAMGGQPLLRRQLSLVEVTHQTGDHQQPT